MTSIRTRIVSAWLLAWAVWACPSSPSLAEGVPAGESPGRAGADSAFGSAFPAYERAWAGPEYWANRLQDWRVRGGRLECLSARPMRTVHLLTRRLAATGEGFEMSVRLGRTAAEPGAMAGFLLAAGGADLDYRSAALIHQAGGEGGGLIAAIDAAGNPFFRDNTGGAGPGQAASPSAPRAGMLPRDAWKILRIDSQEQDTPARFMLDGQARTIWHSQWKEKKAPYPHYVVIDLGQERNFHGLAYLPRADNSVGRIKDYELYAADNDREWGKPLASGTFQDSADEQVVPLPPTRARYIRFVMVSGVTDRPAAVIAELNLLAQPLKTPPGTPATAPAAPPAAAPPAARPAPGKADLGDLSLHLSARRVGEAVELTLQTRKADGTVLATQTSKTPPSRLAGGLALICTGGVGGKGAGGAAADATWWFRDWKLSGAMVQAHDERALGPILSTQYVATGHAMMKNPPAGKSPLPLMRMNVQMMPLAKDDMQSVRLEVRQGEQWKQVAEAGIVTPGWTALLECTRWDITRDWPYRVVYEMKLPAGGTRTCTWGGTIRRDPVDQETFTVAGFTGNHNTVSGVERPTFPWAWGVWFPHADVTAAVARHKADLLFFSGDQVYEGGSPTHPEPVELDYLYKWYLWCWAYRDLTRDIPSIIEPDDHDVYQGNLWGAGGRKIDKDDKGGYVHDAEFVKMAERTQAAHLPPYDPAPIEQGIGTYYNAIVWGRIGVATLEDRKFKSGPNGLVPKTDTARADHVQDPHFDPKRADVAGAELLGPRQEAFLAAWAADWTGQDMKLALSQTTFAGMATHHGGNLQRLRIDYDSNGWPQAGRARALRELRRGFAFHLCGDQHLATIVHQGLEAWNDSIWAFCVPSVANFYPRMWKPDQPGRNRAQDSPEWMGEHTDGLGNKVTVYAATNPDRTTGRQPAALHDKMPGYGIVRMNRRLRTITMECWPRYADPADPQARQYEGWPRTIRQEDNYARPPAGRLPTLKLPDPPPPPASPGTAMPDLWFVPNPVVYVVDEAGGELLYAIRPGGRTFQPWVFDAARTYTVRVTWDDGRPDWVRKGLSPADALQKLEVK